MRPSVLLQKHRNWPRNTSDAVPIADRGDLVRTVTATGFPDTVTSLPSRTFAQSVRRKLRLARASVAFAAIALIAPIWLMVPRRGLALLGWRLLLGGLRVRVTVAGRPSLDETTLYAANHISWLDIAVLGRLLNAGFVAKTEVAGWPLLGKLARRYGCAFIARDRRTSAHRQAASVGDILRQQGSLILFPEGTTGLGNGVLPFRSSLFAAIDGLDDCVVQPVTLSYRADDGTPLTAAELRRVAWLDDDELLPHVRAFAAGARIAVEVHFAEPLPAGDRKTLAAACQQIIARRLNG